MQKTLGKNCFHVCWYGCIDILSLSLHVVEFLLGLVLATLGDVIVIDGRFEPTSHLVWIWLDIRTVEQRRRRQINLLLLTFCSSLP